MPNGPFLTKMETRERIGIPSGKDIHLTPSSPHRPPESSATGGSTLHAIVSGRVQGVGFRFFAVRAARELDLTGRVLNRPDGRVEVWARGSQPRLRALADALQRGPAYGHVDDLQAEWDVPMAPTDDFIIDF